jgi:hypothetical protein
MATRNRRQTRKTYYNLRQPLDTLSVEIICASYSEILLINTLIAKKSLNWREKRNIQINIMSASSREFMRIKVNIENTETIYLERFTRFMRAYAG